MITSDVANEAAVLLQQGVAAAGAGDKDTAKAAFHRSAELNPNNEAVWLWLASLHTDLPVVAHCLQMALAINPANAQAAQALQAVTQKLQQSQNTLVSGPFKGGPYTSGPLAAHPVDQQWQPTQSPGQAQTQTQTQTQIHGQQLLTSGPLAAQHADQQWQPVAEELQPQREQEQPLDLNFDFDELKRRGVVAAKGGRHAEAKAYLLAATDKNESDAEVWYWLSTVVDDPEDKQIALENVLALDPFNLTAQAALDENASLIEQARIVKQSAPGPSAAFEHTAPNAHSQWAELPPPTPYSPSTDSSLGQPGNGLELESPPSVSIGSDSRFFARAGVVDGEEPKQSPAERREGGTSWVIARKYRVLSSTEVADGVGYLASDLKRHTYYVLRPQKREVADIKKSGANYVVYKGTPYTVVAVGTKGLTLRQFISTVGALPPDLVAQYGLAMLKTLAAEHDKGPLLTARKFVTPDTVAFDGLGQILLEPPPEHVVTTKSSGMTAPFLPTEQAQHGTVAPSSDIFAVGALLFYMLTGSPPPDAERIPRKLGGTIVPAQFQGFPEIPEDMAQVIATALQPNPADRYASAKEMAGALKETEAGRRVPKELPKVPIKALAGSLAVVGVMVFAALIATGKIQITLPTIALPQFPGTQPTAVPAVLEPTPIPVPPLSRVIINSVDSRRFPTNHMYFSALDPTGAPMFGLDASSIKLRENGAEINSMGLTELRQTTDAISVIVALDTSEKMAGRYMDNAKTAIHILADRLQPGDHMALVTFADTARLVQDYTVSKEQFLANVDAQQPGGKPVIVAAVAGAAVSVLTQLQGGYTALVIVTNSALPKGKPEALKPTVDNMVKAATPANLPVFFVALDKANISEEAANQVAAATGGVAVYADPPDTGGAGEAIKKVEMQLHNVYKVTYDSPSSSPQADHTLELAITAAGTTHTDKRSYQYWQR